MYLLFKEQWKVIHRAASNQIICMDFENTEVHIISELEPYYSLLLLRIPTQEKIALTTDQDNVY
jgi:hypothetical protein